MWRDLGVGSVGDSSVLGFWVEECGETKFHHTLHHFDLEGGRLQASTTFGDTGVQCVSPSVVFA